MKNAAAAAEAVEDTLVVEIASRWAEAWGESRVEAVARSYPELDSLSGLSDGFAGFEGYFARMKAENGARGHEALSHVGVMREQARTGVKELVEAVE